MRRLAFAANTKKADVVVALKKLVPDLPIGELRERLATGRPFLELTDWQDEENAALIREVIAELDSRAVEPLIYRLRSGDPSPPSPSATARRITKETLANMLQRAAEISREIDAEDEGAR